MGITVAPFALTWTIADGMLDAGGELVPSDDPQSLAVAAGPRVAFLNAEAPTM